MFGLFKKKKPETALDQLIYAIYGNPPPAKRANVRMAVDLAQNQLLMNKISPDEVMSVAIDLNDGPIPYSTHDLALSVALNLFKRPELIPALSEAQILARIQMVEWLQEGQVAPMIAKSFEDTLYKVYKPY
jgi:hypothetical protein